MIRASLGWNWQSRAACRGANAELFDRPHGNEQRIPKSAQYAASYCAECPVRRECGAAADENRDEGVRGGTWRVITSHGYETHQITPLTSRAIRVIHHDHTTLPERAAS